MKPIELYLGETNNLKFKIRIQGVTSNLQESKTKIRFIISEKGNEEAPSMLLSTKKDNEGNIVVAVDGNTNLFEQEKLYEGIIEVCVGNKIFNAASYDISFIQEEMVFESFFVENSNSKAKKPESPSMPKSEQQKSQQHEKSDILLIAKKALAEKLKLSVNDPKIEKLLIEAQNQRKRQR